jgi:4-amino-4-deoxy-L-arabinose transferase-like glycosyltransferase
MTLAVPVRRSRAIGWFFLALAVAALLVASHFVGYDGADDRSYALGAEAWLRHFPAVGADHWATRHMVVLPVAASLALLGPSVFALALPSVLFFAGLIAVNFVFARRHLGDGPAAMLSLLLASTPEFVVQATYINNDIVEAFFASLSFWLFVEGRENGRSSTMIWCGVAAGLAFLTRETSAVLVLFFLTSALIDRHPPRKAYLFVALGFALPVLVEMTYFAAMTGDFLYRYRLDAGHDAVSRVGEFQHMTKTGGALDRQGNLSVGVWADPLLMLFASQKFAALFWLAIPAAIGIWRAQSGVGVRTAVINRVSRLALIWIAFLSLAFPILYLVARYYAVPAWAAVVVLGFAVHQLFKRGHRVAAVAVVALLVAGNALSLYLENTRPRFAEMALTGWLAAHPDARVVLDPDMARRSDLLLRYAGEGRRIRSGIPPAGALYVYSPRNLELCRSTGGCKEAGYRPRPAWQRIDAVAGSPRTLGGLLRRSGMGHSLPPQILAKIETPEPGIVIYRVR